MEAGVSKLDELNEIGHCVESIPESSQNSKSEDDQMSSTPVYTKQQHNELSLSQSVNDSGFGSASTSYGSHNIFNLSAEHGLTPIPTNLFCSRRTTSLPECDISPIAREDTLPKVRRLTFDGLEQIPPLSFAAIDEVDGELPSEKWEEIVSVEKADEIVSVSEENESTKAPLCMAQVKLGSRSSSSRSSFTDELEFSLQEMSLEDSSSRSSISSNSPDLFLPTNKSSDSEMLSESNSFPEDKQIFIENLELSPRVSPKISTFYNTADSEVFHDSNNSESSVDQQQSQTGLDYSPIASSSHPVTDEIITVSGPFPTQKCSKLARNTIPDEFNIKSPTKRVLSRDIFVTSPTKTRKLHSPKKDPFCLSPTKGRKLYSPKKDIFFLSPNKTKHHSPKKDPFSLSPSKVQLSHLTKKEFYLVSPAKSRKLRSPKKISPSKFKHKPISSDLNTKDIQAVRCNLDFDDLKQNLTSNKISDETISKFCANESNSVVNFEFIDAENKDMFLKLLQKFTMCPLHRLIGRSIGLTKMDILGSLFERSFALCVQKVLQYLDVKDLACVRQVCSTWRNAVSNDWDSNFRLMEYKQRHAHKFLNLDENCQRESGARNYRLTESKGRLSSIQQQAAVKVEHRSTSKQDCEDVRHFHDRFRHCPLCQKLAKVLPCQERAVCRSSKCQFDFCTLCFSAFHHPNPCKPLHVTSQIKLVCTKKSRKNLKRL